MAKLRNLAKMTTSTTGTGTITLGSAVSGFLTFAQALVADGEIVTYAIKDGANSEIGYGTYTSSGTTLTRNVLGSTNSNAAISLSGTAEVFITASAQDLQRANVRVASTANVTISSGLENGDVINGITLVTGDLVLLKDQTTQSENGIYTVVASGTASRTPGFQTWNDFVGREIIVHEGKARHTAPYIADTATATNNTSVSSAVVTNPGGLEVGDLLIMTVGVSGTYTAATGPSGWAAPSGITNSDSNRLITFAHIADSTDVAASNFTVSWSTSTRRYAAALYVIRGHDGSSWNNTSANGTQVTSATITSPKPTPTVDKCLTLRVAAQTASSTLSSISGGTQFIAGGLPDDNPGSGPRAVGTAQELSWSGDNYATVDFVFSASGVGLANQITIAPALLDIFSGTQVWTSDAGLTGTLGTDALTFSRGDEYGGWELIQAYEPFGQVPCIEFMNLDSFKYSRYRLAWTGMYTIENTSGMQLVFGRSAAPTTPPTWMFDQYSYRSHVWYVNIDAPDTDGDDDVYATDTFAMYLGNAEGNLQCGNNGWLEITPGLYETIGMTGQSVYQQFNGGSQLYNAGYHLLGHLWDANITPFVGITAMRIFDSDSDDCWGPGSQIYLYGMRRWK